MNKKISVNMALAIAIIAMTVTFSVTMILSQNLFDATVSSVREKEIMYNKIAEIDKTVRTGYYGEISDETLYDMMGAGYMQGISDSNARYYTARQYSDYLDDQSGRIVGVGVEVIKETSGYARILRVYNGSPAQDAGITPNTYITKIGDTDLRTLSLSQINALLRGDAGTTVTLSLLNATAEELPDVQLQRRQYDIPSVHYAMQTGGNIGYVRISTFNSVTATELRNAIEQLRILNEDLSALVLDVRNNTGGNLDAAMKSIDLLCPAGAIANLHEKDGSVSLWDTSDQNEVDLPMVVLVNNTTAAGAELFATSIRDFNKGRIVGVTTAGKGRVQCDPVRLSDGSAVSYTIGLLLTKEEASFDGVGVIPDVESSLRVEDERNFHDLTIDTDSQITKAFETAAALVNRQIVMSGETSSSQSNSSASSESTDTADDTSATS